MGFEWSLEAGTAGTRDAFGGDPAVVAFSWREGLSLDLVFEGGIDVFVRYGQTSSARA